MIFDTHVHYDDRRFDEDRGAVLDALHVDEGGCLCGLFKGRIALGVSDERPKAVALDDLNEVPDLRFGVAVREFGKDGLAVPEREDLAGLELLQKQ